MSINNLNIFLDELAADAVIPSTTAAVKIRPLTVRQIKDVVDTTLLIPYFDIGFKQAAMNVFKNNTIFNATESNKNITEFDFQLLFPYLKSDGEYEGLPVRNFLEKPIDITALELTKEVVYKNFTFKLQSPTIDSVKAHQDFLTSKMVLNQEQQLENEQEVSTIYYLTELSRYVDAIMHDDTDILLGQDLSNRLRVIENIPYQVATEILNFSSKLEDYVSKHNKIDDISINLDMSFFS